MPSSSEGQYSVGITCAGAAAMKRGSKKTVKSPARKAVRRASSDMSAADRAVEEIRAIRRQLWKESGAGRVRAWWRSGEERACLGRGEREKGESRLEGRGFRWETRGCGAGVSKSDSRPVRHRPVGRRLFQGTRSAAAARGRCGPIDCLAPCSRVRRLGARRTPAARHTRPGRISSPRDLRNARRRASSSPASRRASATISSSKRMRMR